MLFANPTRVWYMLTSMLYYKFSVLPYLDICPSSFPQRQHHLATLAVVSGCADSSLLSLDGDLEAITFIYLLIFLKYVFIKY